MVAMIRTRECFPTELTIGDQVLAAPPVDHDGCPGGHTFPGLLGGWRCSCPCHHATPQWPTTVDDPIDLRGST